MAPTSVLLSTSGVAFLACDVCCCVLCLWCVLMWSWETKSDAVTLVYDVCCYLPSTWLLLLCSWSMTSTALLVVFDVRCCVPCRWRSLMCSLLSTTSACAIVSTAVLFLSSTSNAVLFFYVLRLLLCSKSTTPAVVFFVYCLSCCVALQKYQLLRNPRYLVKIYEYIVVSKYGSKKCIPFIDWLS